MKLTYDPIKDHRTLRKLVHDFIMLHPGATMSAMDFRVAMNREWGINVDHHEFAYELDHMRGRGEVEYKSHNYGDTKYFVTGIEIPHP